jgi:phage terminase small subunit
MDNKPKSKAYESLPIKRQRFVDEYLVDCNGLQAAIRAGYAPKAAGQMADQLLNIPQVMQAVEDRKAELTAKAEDHRSYLIEKCRLIIDKCCEPDRWSPSGANGAARNLIDIIGARSEKQEISIAGSISVQPDLSNLDAVELKRLHEILQKAQPKPQVKE